VRRLPASTVACWAGDVLRHKQGIFSTTLTLTAATGLGDMTLDHGQHCGYMQELNVELVVSTFTNAAWPAHNQQSMKVEHTACESVYLMLPMVWLPGPPDTVTTGSKQ
jgi:hypothetical protein